MDIKFGKDQTPVTPAGAAAPATTTAVPVTEPQKPQPAAQVSAVQNANRSLGPTGLLLGDKIPDFKDIILPRINLVQNIGELKASFTSGCLVLGRQTVLFAPPASGADGKVVPATAPVTLTVAGFKDTRYSEKVSGGVIGLTVDTEQEVLEAGGTLDYKEWDLKKASGMKLFQPLADALVVVERPDICADDDTVFTYEVAGKKYALALWAMKGTSYTEAAKRVFFTARAVGILRKGYPSYCFAVSTREKPYPNGNRAWIPICNPIRQNDETLIAFVRSIIGGPEEEAQPA